MSSLFRTLVLNTLQMAGNPVGPDRCLKVIVRPAPVMTVVSTVPVDGVVGIERQEGAEVDVYGRAEVKIDPGVLPPWLRHKETEARFHSGHGLYLRVEIDNLLLPTALKPGADPCIHLTLMDGPGGWRWRWVGALPDDKPRVKDFSVELFEALERHTRVDGGTMSLSRESSQHLGGLPQWSNLAGADEWRGNDVPNPVLAISLVDVTVAFIHDEAALLLKPTLLRLTREAPTGPFLVELREGPEPTVVKHELVLKGNGEPGPRLSSPWRLTMDAVSPQDAAVRADNGAGGAVIWIHDPIPDEWLRIEPGGYATDAVEGETRRWPLGKLLKSPHGDTQLSLWLDNSGSKVVRLRFNLGADLQSATMAVDRPFVELRPGPLFAHAGSAVPVALIPAATGRSAFSLELAADGSYVLGRENSSAVHWQRSPSSIVAPVQWSSELPDPARADGRSRGLLPIQCRSWRFKPASTAVIVTEAATKPFPAFSVGGRLRIASADPQRARLEVEITGDAQAVVRLRHASPHLDAYYASSGGNVGGASEDATWVTGRWVQWPGQAKPIEGPVTLAELLDNVAWTHPPAAAGTPTVEPIVNAAPIVRNVGPLSVLQYPGRQRWAVAPSATLLACLGGGLRLDVFGLSEDMAGPEAVEFSIAPSKPVSGSDFRRGRLSCSVTGGWSGSVVLGQDWLMRHHRDYADEALNWSEEARGGPAIRFLGVESKKVDLVDSAGVTSVQLGALRYWFRLEGVTFRVDTQDVLTLADGKWSLPEDAAMAVVPVDGTPCVVFSRRDLIIPGLYVEECLLGNPDRDWLTVSYAAEGSDSEPIAFEVGTTYHIDPGKAKGYIALWRGASYHLAWAGEHGAPAVVGAGGADVCVGQLKMGALTRLFLRIDRSAEGRLVARGMIGWACNALVVGGVDYGAQAGSRATVYADVPGEWTRVRLSGLWTADQGIGAIALPRIDLLLAPVRSGSYPVPTLALARLSVSEPIVVKHRYFAPGAANANEVHAWGGLSIDASGKISLAGRVRLMRVETTSDLPKSAVQRSTVDLEWQAPFALRRNLSWTSKDQPWFSVEVGDVSNDVPRWMQSAKKELFDADFHVQPPSQAFEKLAGLTRLRDSDLWLLCPVTETSAGSLTDERPKLWVLTKDGEDLIQFEGFDEMLGQRLSRVAETDDDVAALRRAAERMLSFVRWRTPAVLEYWRAGAPVWSIVDAPLVNPFSSLTFMDALVDADIRLNAPAAGVVDTRVMPMPVPAALAWRPTSDTDPVGVLRVSNPAGYLTGYLQMTREVRFDQGPDIEGYVVADEGDDVWLAESLGWPAIKPGAAIDAWRSFMPDTRWSMATPRPGERIGFSAEASWMMTDGGDVGSQAAYISGVAGVVGRSPVGAAGRSVSGFVRSESGVAWRMGEALLPEERLLAKDGTRLLIGSPNAKVLSIGRRFVVAAVGLDGGTTAIIIEFKHALRIRLNVDAPPQLVARATTFSSTQRMVIAPTADSMPFEMTIEVEANNEAKPQGGGGAVDATGQVAAAGTATVHLMPQDQAAEWLRNLEVTSPPDALEQLALSATAASPAAAIPTTVALRDAKARVMTYRPVDPRYRLEPSDRGLQWQAWGEWLPVDSSLVQRVHTVLLFADDGGLTEMKETN